MKWKIIYCSLTFALLLLVMPDVAVAEDKMSKKKHLIDFSDSDDSGWNVINDGVMGGVSRSNIQRIDE